MAKQDDPAFAGRINQFSLVSYIPGRLGEFLDSMRRQLEPGCVAQSHVTLLPPRPLHVEPHIAAQEIRLRAAPFSPFEIHLSGVSVFAESFVIFAEVGLGYERLEEMHRALNVGPLAQNESFAYHPHVTLAQGLKPEDVDDALQCAQRLWTEAPSPSFVVDTLTFVQNTLEKRWIDLSECELRGFAEALR